MAKVIDRYELSGSQREYCRRAGLALHLLASLPDGIGNDAEARELANAASLVLPGSWSGLGEDSADGYRRHLAVAS